MDFSLQIVKDVLIENGEEKNLILSPLSIAALSSILAFGPLGSESTLKLLDSETLDDLKSNYTKLAAASSSFSETSKGEDPVVSFVNGAWADQTIGFESSFEHALKSVFNAGTKLLDFQNQAAESAKEINSWVEKSTKGLISEIIDKESLKLATMILANALYFKGQWKDKFELNKFDRCFYTGKGEQSEAQFMRSDSDYMYRSFKNFRVAQIPYKSGHGGRQFSMNLFLPNANDGLPALLEEFSTNPSLFLNETLSALYCQDFEEFMIPKFKFSYGRGLTDIMTKLGLDMGGVEVLQKPRIIVDEEGTEAAAVTYAVEYYSMGGSPPKLPRFVADHPFMFVIREDTTGMPVFVGVVVNPLAEN